MKITIECECGNKRTMEVPTKKSLLFRDNLEAGHFTEGSMAPKIRAAILFVEATGHEAIITEATKLGDPTCGTRIVA